MVTATLDRAFDALASEPRRAIIERLARGSLTTPELGRAFPISKQALSRHVGVLEDAGLLHRRRFGRVHELRLASDSLDPVTDWVDRSRAAWQSNLDRLDDVLGGTT